MKNFKTNSLALILVSFSMQSCLDDLNVDVSDPLRDEAEAFFAQPNAYRTFMAGVYGNLALTGTNGPGSSFIGGIDAGTSQYGRVLWYMQNLSTDEVIWSYENDPGTREIQRNTWNSVNPIFRGMYGRGMIQVALVNDFLRESTEAKLDSRGISDSERVVIAEYRNEARALRALAYYHLMDLFGKAAFVDENTALLEPGVQYDRSQLFAFIESELLEILPNLKAPRTNEEGRLDQGFARMTLAKIYLNSTVYTGQAKNQECIDILNPIMGAYSLEPVYHNNFNADNHNSNEMIFAVPSDGIRMQSFSAITVIINGQVGNIEENGLDFGVSEGGWGGALRVRKQFVEKFNGAEYTNDVRNTIISAGRPVDIANVEARDQGYVIAKFSNKTAAGVNGSDQTFPDTDYPMYRLGDAYLMYAEAQVRKDGTANSTSLGYINQSLS
jgi:hypothetical protein